MHVGKCDNPFTERSKSLFEGIRSPPSVVLFATRMYTEFFISRAMSGILIVMSVHGTATSMTQCIDKAFFHYLVIT